jgi:hypothetical protein
MSGCKHEWFMCNLRNGYLVVEGCWECGARSSFFSAEPVPPIDEYREGHHFWSYMGSFQTVKFDLECRLCRLRVCLDDVNGLMMSECTNPECRVGALAMEPGAGALVYVALCADSTHSSGKCVSPDGIAALNEYFNPHLEDLGRRVVVVPCRMCSSVDRCPGTMIVDIGLTDIQ